MQDLLIYLCKIIKKTDQLIALFYYKLLVNILFYLNGVEHSSFYALGKPRINISLGGTCVVGKLFKIRSGAKFSETGENSLSKILVGKLGKLKIGNNVGITSVTIVCHDKVTIEDNVKIGGGSILFDTNFHSIDPVIRASSDDNVRTSPIHIKNNVFIGTSCIICKGITIGENSIIAAGSVVVKSIPSNEVWGGNPAKFIRSL